MEFDGDACCCDCDCDDTVDVDGAGVAVAAADDDDGIVNVSTAPPSPSVLLDRNSDRTRSSSECVSWRFKRRRVVRRSRITPRNGDGGSGSGRDGAAAAAADGVFDGDVVIFCRTRTLPSPLSSSSS